MNDTIATLFVAFLYLLIVAIIVRSLLSWFPNAQNNEFARILHNVTEPLLQPVRQIMPRTGMIDFSAMVVLILLYVMIVVVQTAAGISFQRMDDTFTTYGAKVDEAAGTITLAGGGPGQRPAAGAPTQAGVLTFERPSPDRLALVGEMDGRKVRMELTYYDRENFRLVQGRFRWVQQTPFNR